MNIDIDYAFLYYVTNVNIFEFHWKGYGFGDWYDKKIESRKEARARIKAAVWEDIFDEYPHLKGQEINYTESFSGELPVIQNRDR